MQPILFDGNAASELILFDVSNYAIQLVTIRRKFDVDLDVAQNTVG